MELIAAQWRSQYSFCLVSNNVCGVAVSRLGGDRISVGCGGPSLMIANLTEKHSVAYIWACLWLE